MTLDVSYFKEFQVKDFSETLPITRSLVLVGGGRYLLKLLNRRGYVRPIYLRKSHN